MKSNYKNIDEANNKIDSIIKQFETCKEQIQKENKQQKEIINKLKDEIKEANSDAGIFITEIEELKEDNKILIEIKNIWFESHRIVTQENEQLKKELKEYRGF